jgi:hypothetical protein
MPAQVSQKVTESAIEVQIGLQLRVLLRPASFPFPEYSPLRANCFCLWRVSNCGLGWVSFREFALTTETSRAQAPLAERRSIRVRLD